MSHIGVVKIYDAALTESAIISDPGVNVISIEIILYYPTKRFIANPLLWNIRRSISGQAYFSAEPVVCAWSPNEDGLRLDFTKPDRKTPYKLFVTFNFMNEFYSGVLYLPIPICNEEPKQNRVDIRNALQLCVSESPMALEFNRDQRALTEALEMAYYDDQEILLQQLLFGAFCRIEHTVPNDYLFIGDNELIDLGKEKRFFDVFKTYSQLGKAWH